MKGQNANGTTQNIVDVNGIDGGKKIVLEKKAYSTFAR